MSRIKYGWPKLEQYAKEYAKDVEKRAKQIVIETAQIIQSNAKALAPVDDGALRDSITMRIEDGGLTAVVEVGVFYAVDVCRPCW